MPRPPSSADSSRLTRRLQTPVSARSTPSTKSRTQISILSHLSSAAETALLRVHPKPPQVGAQRLTSDPANLIAKFVNSATEDDRQGTPTVDLCGCEAPLGTSSASA